MKQVYLDFLGGSHGHFLEFILNGLDEPNDKLLFENPFSIDGSARNNGVHSHNKFITGEKRFVAGHYTSIGAVYRVDDPENKAITITVNNTEESYFNWIKIRLIRGWMPEFSPGPLEDLHNNTYDKLISWPEEQRKIQGDEIASPGAITLKLFFSNINNFLGNTIDADNKSTNKWCIRNFLKQRYFSDDGRKIQLKINTRQLADIVVEFKFLDFYNKINFVDNLIRLAEEFNLTITETRLERIKELHNKFLSKNQLLEYNGFERCNIIFNNLKSKEPLPYLSLLEESYVLSLIDKLLGKSTVYKHDEFFKTPVDVAEYIETNK